MKSKGNNNKPILKVLSTQTITTTKRYHSADVYLTAVPWLHVTIHLVWGYKHVHHACKMCHHNAQGYAVGKMNPQWKELRDVLKFICYE
jgi:hypothetical protein